MHNAIHFNGEICPAIHANIPALSPTVLYGKGVFTTIAVYDGKPFLWEKHWRRLSNDADVLGIDIKELSEGSVRAAFDEIVSANSVAEGRARITLFDESPSAIWPSRRKAGTGVLITTDNRRPVSEDLRVEISTARVSSLSRTAGIKSCNYLDNLLAYEEAERHGFNEAIRLNERGEIASGCMANVFWLEGKKLFTPNLTTGCLAGTTREFVLENLDVEEVNVGKEKIDAADAIFLTSAGLGVARVSELSGRLLGGQDHPILSLIPANPA
jgi:branched-subunit amino acid aminotransferase/4-amino-4-deoxychorismate lyase